MSGLLCPCGHGMSTIQCPNDCILHILTDMEWDERTEIDENARLVDIDDDAKYEYWHCKKCGRVTVINWSNGKPVRYYAIEKEFPENDYEDAPKYDPNYIEPDDRL